MKMVFLFPPNYAEINKAFKVRGKKIWFCYGDTIFNPSRMKVPPQIMAHEEVHSRQQGDDPAGWWKRYIADPAFRLDQEIAAHRAELADMVRQGVERGRALVTVATRLTSPIYGNLIEYRDAVAAIRDAAPESQNTASIDAGQWGIRPLDTATFR